MTLYTMYHILMTKDNFGITPVLLCFNDTLMPDFQKSLCIKKTLKSTAKMGFPVWRNLFHLS